jgi:hypothetical protein
MEVEKWIDQELPMVIPVFSMLTTMEQIIKIKDGMARNTKFG